MKTQRTMDAPELYEIRVAGHLSERWAARYEGLSLRHEPGGETVLPGRLDIPSTQDQGRVVRSADEEHNQVSACIRLSSSGVNVFTSYMA